MRILCLVAIVLATVVISCKPEQSPVYMSDAQLVSLLVDLHVANAAVSRATNHLQDSLRHAYKEDVARKYGITVDEITSNLEHLRTDFAHMEGVYQAVLDTLTKKLDFYNDY